MRIEQAEKSQSAEIAALIMEAMNYECCQNLAGEHHTLKDFYIMMNTLVSREDSQYSYLNTLVAMTDDDLLTGICVTYDGSKLHQLREAFIQEAKIAFDIDYSNMDDETQAGELYIDSLCVAQEFRHQGIAQTLLHAAIKKAKQMGIPQVGLLVDKGNPDAERLYTTIGFEYSNDSIWGGHPMKHLVYNIQPISNK